MAESVLPTMIRTGRLAVRAPEMSGCWPALAAPVGRPGAYNVVIAVYRPGPDAEPFTDRDEEFV
ncbi:hypothetical protein BCD49_33660 [Pseudofrankia sp. EUN1h]|nr:hypothetical protein BCD49_33660 [Pseudofrankia sp. EUN1h]